MVVDASGAMVSAREIPALFGVTAQLVEAEGRTVRLASPGHESIEVSPRGTERGEDWLDVSLFGQVQLRGVPAGEAASEWISDVTGRPDLRLVWCGDPTQRSLHFEQAKPGDHTGYTDACPVTLASTASLARLNDWMTEAALERGDEPPAPLPIERFRANLTIDGHEPFGEDRWTRVRVGEVTFRSAGPVSRCVMTTIDPATITKSKEPIRTLARHRRWDGQTWFAIHLIPDTEGRVSVGDPVEVLA